MYDVEVQIHKKPTLSDTQMLNKLCFFNLKYCLNESLHVDPSIAQLVERWTVDDSSEIHRSLVQIRFEGDILNYNSVIDRLVILKLLLNYSS